jgi:hypothetical protein
MLFEEVVGVIKLLDVVVLELLIVVAPVIAPLAKVTRLRADVPGADTLPFVLIMPLLIVTPPMLFEEAVGVIKLLDLVVLELLIVVAPDRAPVIVRLETPDTALVLMVTPPT